MFKIGYKAIAVPVVYYNNAVANGDKNVYLLTGADLTALCGNEGTVDNAHPTDFGFASMAMAVSEVFSNIEIK